MLAFAGQQGADLVVAAAPAEGRQRPVEPLGRQVQQARHRVAHPPDDDFAALGHRNRRRAVGCAAERCRIELAGILEDQRHRFFESARWQIGDRDQAIERGILNPQRGTDLPRQPSADRFQVLGGEGVFGERRGVAGHAHAAGLLLQVLQRQVAAPLLFQCLAQHGHTAGLLEECGVAPRFVLDQVRGQHIGFTAPLLDRDANRAEALVAGLLPQLLQDLQPRVAAHVEHVALGAGPAHH